MNTILLQSEGIMGLAPFILILVVMYLFFFRPQMKKQKEEKLFRNEVKKGTRIVTTSGIHAKILEVGDTYLVIESENSRFKIEKSAVSKELSAQYSK
ncbi:MAG: preprotein translocase subunit YajC [Schleiferiaceae bacterium]|nr:preprotein translocase subunit YajC [Schleiferiaceae bacterium]